LNIKIDKKRQHTVYLSKEISDFIKVEMNKYNCTKSKFIESVIKSYMEQEEKKEDE
jgi:hypothetical protein